MNHHRGGGGTDVSEELPVYPEDVVGVFGPGEIHPGPNDVLGAGARFAKGSKDDLEAPPGLGRGIGRRLRPVRHHRDRAGNVDVVSGHDGPRIPGHLLPRSARGDPAALYTAQSMPWAFWTRPEKSIETAFHSVNSSRDWGPASRWPFPVFFIPPNGS